MAADRARIRRFLEQANFRPMLFELGWDRLRIDPFRLEVSGIRFEVSPIAGRSGVQVLEVVAADGYIPPGNIRWAVSSRLRRRAHEHLSVWVNASRGEFLWQAPPGASLRHGVSSHRAFAKAIGSGIVALISGLDLRPLGDNPGIAAVAMRVARAFRDDRRGYYTDYYHRLAAAEAEAGIMSQPVRKSIWHYEDNIASREFDEDDFQHLGTGLGASGANALRPPLPLDTGYSPVHRDRLPIRRGLLRADLLRDPAGRPVETEVAHRLLREQLELLLSSLTSRQRRVLQLRFGLKDGRAWTLEEVGREFGVTRERIRQIEAKAIQQLRQASRSRMIVDYVDMEEPEAHFAHLPASSVPSSFWSQLYPLDAGMVFAKVLLRLSESLDGSDSCDGDGAPSSAAFRQYCDDLRRRRAALEHVRALARTKGGFTTLFLRCRTGYIKLTDVPHATARLVVPPGALAVDAKPASLGLDTRRASTASSVARGADAGAAGLSSLGGSARATPPAFDPVDVDLQLLEEDDFIIADPQPDLRPAAPRQQPLELPGALPLFQQPAPPAAREAPLTRAAGQLLFKGLEPEPPPGADRPLTRKERLDAVAAAFSNDGYSVVDDRGKGGALWVHDPEMQLANRIEGLRSIGIKFVYAEHKPAGKWGWWIR